MFGCIVSGRLIQTEAQQIDQTHFVFNIENTENINHVVVFLLGTVPFPDGLGGSVFFSWPSPEGPQWQLLGHISNQKPSAIFKITKVKPEDIIKSGPFGMMAAQANFQNNTISQIGISVEPLSSIAQQTPAVGVQPSAMDSFTQFTTKMLENFYNYASSFAVTQAQMVPQPNETFVPSSALQNWFTNFQRRLQQNPNFWKS
ncbi:protein Hikeshi-like [Ptychodera flava]|uniref:protein Hikeshi-like n=1 Tax=Ptychodera flava TaxID=63121 RepID=UPI00396A53FE